MTDHKFVSTGRGGAGNIGNDERVYVDAGIVREGVAGESSASEYSSGRGGAGNIVDSPQVRPQNGSEEVVPETATRETRAGDSYDNFHTGRGGQGNVYKEKYGGHSTPQKGQEGHEESLGEKIGDKLKGLLQKK